VLRHPSDGWYTRPMIDEARAHHDVGLIRKDGSDNVEDVLDPCHEKAAVLHVGPSAYATCR